MVVVQSLDQLAMMSRHLRALPACIIAEVDSIQGTVDASRLSVVCPHFEIHLSASRSAQTSLLLRTHLMLGDQESHLNFAATAAANLRELYAIAALR